MKIIWKYLDWSFLMNETNFLMLYSLIIQVIVLVSDWFILDPLSLNFSMVLLFNSILVFFRYGLLNFCVWFACNNVVRRNCFLDDVFRSDVPVDFLWLIIVLKLLASFWSLVFVWNWVVPDTVCVTSVVSEDFVLVLDFLLFKLLLFALLFPTFLIPLHSFHQSCLIKMIFPISLMFSDNPVVDFVIFVEALFFLSYFDGYLWR